jgi:hypothetical protein
VEASTLRFFRDPGEGRDRLHAYSQSLVTLLRLGGSLAGIVGALVAVTAAALIDVFPDEYRAKCASKVRSLGR